MGCCAKLIGFLVRTLGSLFIGFFVLPLTAPIYRIREGFMFLWRQERRVSSPAEHRKKVTAVQDQVRQWNAGGRLRKMCTARPAAMAITVLKRDKRNLAQIDLSSLSCLVEIDEINGTLTVEPGLKMGQLTAILAGRGWKWTIPVVPEFEALTIGGTICGAGIESGSTRYGFIADSAVGFEVVLSSGEVVNCSKDENSDLFYTIPWSHGTIGFLTAVKFPLVRAGKYVKLEYHATDSVDEAQSLLETQDHAFVEGLMFGPHQYVVMHGDFVDVPVPDPTVGGSVNHITRWYKPLFHNYVHSFVSRSTWCCRRRPSGSGGGPHVDYIPTVEYYHRHSRSGFWAIPLALPILNNRLYLALFGWVLPVLDINSSKAVLDKILTIGSGVSCYGLFLESTLNLLEDYVIPIRHLKSFLDSTHQMVGCYPLWLCPAKLYNTPGLTHCSPGLDSELFIDVGVYGNASREARAAGFEPVAAMRQFEELTAEKEGYVLTYADMYLSREQWRSMFDMRLYDEVRVKYDCEEAFPEVYDKVIKNAIRLN